MTEDYYTKIHSIYNTQVEDFQKWLKADVKNSQNQEKHPNFQKIIDFYFEKATDNFISFRALTKFQAINLFEKILKHLSDSILNNEYLAESVEYTIDITDGPEIYPRFRNIDREWNLQIQRFEDTPNKIIILVDRTFARKFRVYFQLEGVLSKYYLHRVIYGDLKSFIFHKINDNLTENQIFSKLTKPISYLATDDFMDPFLKMKNSLSDQFKIELKESYLTKPQNLNHLLKMLRDDEDLLDNYAVFTQTGINEELEIFGNDFNLINPISEGYETSINEFLEDNKRRFLIIKLKEQFKFHEKINELRNHLDHEDVLARRIERKKVFILVLHLERIKGQRTNFISLDEHWTGLGLKTL